MNPRSWSLRIHVLSVLAVAVAVYALQRSTSGTLENVVSIVGSLVITILGVTLADRLMTRRGVE